MIWETRSDTIWYEIWDKIRYDMMRYETRYDVIRYDMRYEIRYDMSIYWAISAGVPIFVVFRIPPASLLRFQVAHSGFGSEVGTPMASGCVTPVQLAPVGQAITLVPMGVSASNRLVFRWFFLGGLDGSFYRSFGSWKLGVGLVGYVYIYI